MEVNQVVSTQRSWTVPSSLSLPEALTQGFSGATIAEVPLCMYTHIRARRDD